MMWRIIFLFILLCSIGLNVYLLGQKNFSLLGANFPYTNCTTNIADNSKSLSTGSQKNSPFNNNLLTEKFIRKTDNESTSKNNLINELTVNSDDTEINNLPVQIKQAIIEQDYSLAAVLINGFEQKDHLMVLSLKSFWFDDAERLIKTMNFISAENSLIAFLEYSPDDLDFLFLSVDLYVEKQQILLAINHAFNIQFHAFDEAQQQNSIMLTNSLIRQEIKRLFDLGLWLELAEFTQQVGEFDLEPFYIQWIYAVALYEQGDFETSLNELEPLLEQANYKLKATALFDRIEIALREPSMIPLERQGEHYIVQGLINEDYTVSLMIDTGASISLLSQSAFDQISPHTEFEYVKDIRLNTAGGQVISSIYKVAKFELQGYKVKNILFAVSPYISEGNDGLLGMNFLSSFDFHIDQNNNLLTLENK
ncbi:MAG: clan AA aspartic protease [Alteromonadaceae bacterium]|nr:clan AA aspartic protease [Alteromonadaceae bacterium]